MSRQTTISLVGAAAIAVALLGASSASAAPANGAIIGQAATTSEVTQKVLWRGGWRGGGWRHLPIESDLRAGHRQRYASHDPGQRDSSAFR